MRFFSPRPRSCLDAINFLIFQSFLLYIHYMKESVRISWMPLSRLKLIADVFVFVFHYFPFLRMGMGFGFPTELQGERRLFTLRDELKKQFRATQKAQINETKAAESKRRLTSCVSCLSHLFHPPLPVLSILPIFPFLGTRVPSCL